VLTVSWSAQDPGSVETIFVNGLSIKADSTATAGPITATLGGTFAPFFAPSATSTTTATGVIQASNTLGSGADTADVLLTSVCPFDETLANAVNSLASFSDAADARAVTAVAAPATGLQLVTFAAGTVAHPAGTTVTQTISQLDCGAAVLPSAVGVIANALGYASAGNPNVFAGESNSGPAGVLTLTESGVGFLPDGTTVTLKITTPGVLFSTRPIADVTAPSAGLALIPTAAAILLTSENLSTIDCVTIPSSDCGTAPTTLSADRTSASFTVDTASTAASTIQIRNIYYDVASTVAGGTFVTVQVSAGGKLVNPTDRTNAVVGRGLTATATPTTVNIGQNAQKTGLVTITELAAGFFQGGTGTNNTIEVCLINNAENFTSPGPSAKVSAGDLVLRSGDVAAAAGATVPGTAVFFATTGDWCYTWKVWTASTKVSTIVIGNSDFSAGPLVDVPANSVPGAVNMAIFVGNGDVIPTSSAVSATVQIATAVFQNQVVVTALSQPTIQKGATDALAGNIQIAETANGQLKLGEDICVEVLPRTSNNAIQDTFLKALNTADVPVAAVSGGLLISPVSMSTRTCEEIQDGTLTPSGTHTVSFSFEIQQQSVAATGKIVISNIHYVTVADAPTGNVLVNVFGFSGSPTSVWFQATVSNAKIAGGPKLSIGAVSALGLKPTTGYTTKTPKTQVKGKYVTWKFTGGQTLAGQRVNVLWAKKVGGAWGGPVYLKSAVADANGIVTIALKSNTAAGINVRVQWPGSISFGVSSSKALGAYWK
jgi:hypothetical protein